MGTVDGRSGGRRLPPALVPALLLAALAAVVATAVLAGATITGDQPPATGDWLVTHPTTVTGEDVALAGGVRVSSQLTVEASTLRLAPASNGSLGVYVDAGGRLGLDGSTLRSSTAYGYLFVVRGELDANGSTLRNCHQGVQVLSDMEVTLASCTIIDPYLVALSLEGANNTTIRDVRVQGGLWKLPAIAATGVADDANPLCQVVAMPPGVVRLRRCAPRIDGLEVSVGRVVTLAVRLEKRTSAARFVVNLEAPLVEVADGAVLRASNLSLHDSLFELSRTVVLHNYVLGGSAQLTLHLMATGVAGIGDGGIALANASMYKCGWAMRGDPSAVTREGLATSVSVFRIEPMPCLVASYMPATFDDAGPHRAQVFLEGCHLQNLRLLECSLYPGYVGTSAPTFELVVSVANCTTRYGMDLIELSFEPRFTLLKTLKASVRVVGCSFEAATDQVLNISYLPGSRVVAPETGNVRPFLELEEDLLVERCSFLRCAGGSAPTVQARAEQLHVANSYECRWRVLECRFERTTGWLLGMSGHSSVAKGRESLTIGSCAFLNCSGPMPGNPSGQRQWVSLQDWSNLEVSNCTFANVTFDLGVSIESAGLTGSSTVSALLKLCDNAFREASVFSGNPFEAYLVLVRWGGDLEVCRNDISLSQTVFLNASEDPELAGLSRLAFHNNTVHDYAGTVLMLSRVDALHARLEATVRDNSARNLSRPLLDYPHLAIEPIQEDYDPVIRLLNNTASDCSAPVLVAYGDIEVDGNRFERCSAFAVRLVNLHLYPPLIGNNTFSGCEGAYYVGSKFWVPAPTLLFATGDYVNCTGTAYYFFQMEATLRNVTVAPEAATAIVAEESLVDAYDSSIEAGSGRVIWRGHIRVWLGLEAFVEWYNATGAPSGRGVPLATVQYRDSLGTLAAVGQSGPDGRAEPVTLRQWSVEWYVGAANLTVHTPYNLTGMCQSYSGVVRVDLVPGLLGDGAVHVPVYDTDLPVVRITWPIDGNLTNEFPLNVTGLMSDLGSGILNVTLWWDGGGGPVNATLLPRERFNASVPLPDGTRRLTALALDIAGNPARHTITVRVDHTPPSLVVTEPPDGLVTADRTVRVRGTFEPGSRVWIDIAEQPGESGVLDTAITLLEGPNVVTVRAVDQAGNVATVVLHLTLDTIPPTLAVFLPKDGSTTRGTPVAVDGRAEGASSVELRVVHPNGEVFTGSVVPAADGSFLAAVPLREGRNELVVRAVDLAGNEALARLYVTLDSTPPEVVILSPADGTVTREQTVHVVARVGLDAVQVLVNGKRASGRPDVDAVVVLSEGANTISVSARDDVGNERTERVTVTLDTVAPHIVIDSPAVDPLVTNDPVVTVAGRVEGGADTLTVAGRAVMMGEGGAFELVLTLQLDGMHQVPVVATDVAGNQALVTLTVELDRTPPLLELTFDPAGPVIRGGDGRLAVYGRTDPSAVRVVVNVTSGGSTRTMALAPGNASLFNVTLSLARGASTVVVSVLDRFGNWNVAEPHAVSFEGAPEPVVPPLVRPVALMVYAIIVAVSILAAGLYLARRRRRRGPGAAGGARRA